MWFVFKTMFAQCWVDIAKHATVLVVYHAVQYQLQRLRERRCTMEATFALDVQEDRVGACIIGLQTVSNLVTNASWKLFL